MAPLIQIRLRSVEPRVRDRAVEAFPEAPVLGDADTDPPVQVVGAHRFAQASPVLRLADPALSQDLSASSSPTLGDADGVDILEAPRGRILLFPGDVQGEQIALDAPGVAEAAIAQDPLVILIRGQFDVPVVDLPVDLLDLIAGQADLGDPEGDLGIAAILRPIKSRPGRIALAGAGSAFPGALR